MESTQNETSRYTLVLPRSLRDRIEDLARLDRRSLNQQIVVAIEEMCDDRDSKAE